MNLYKGCKSYYIIEILEKVKNINSKVRVLSFSIFFFVFEIFSMEFLQQRGIFSLKIGYGYLEATLRWSTIFNHTCKVINSLKIHYNFNRIIMKEYSILERFQHNHTLENFIVI